MEYRLWIAEFMMETGRLRQFPVFAYTAEDAAVKARQMGETGELLCEPRPVKII